MAFLLVIHLFVSVALQTLLGQRLAASIASALGAEKREESDPLSVIVFFALGLLTYLLLLLIFLSLGIPRGVSLFLPYGLLFLGMKRGSYFPLPKLSISFSIWFFVQLCIGVTLFQVTSGIESAWRNNYGDLAFHLGMISSFTHGDVFPPEYHLYAGASLSYPFLINLWSASLWWFDPTWRNLSLIFVFQWCLIWSGLYFLLRGNRYPLIPWALLLAGGAYLFEHLGSNSGKLIAEGYPWTSFLTTIWVPQRAAMLGALSALVALHLLFDRSDGRSGYEITRSKNRLFLSGLMLGLSPLVHFHICFTVGLFALLLLCMSENWHEPRRAMSRLALFVLPALLSLLSVPLLLEKASTISFMNGWYSPGDTPANPLFSTLFLWVRNALPVFVIFSTFALFSRWRRALAILLVLFLLANGIQLSIWEWDQIKVYLALYMMVLFLWSREEQPAFASLQVVLILLMVPSVAEIYEGVRSKEVLQIYSSTQLEEAETIRENTPSDAILLSDSAHNATATLAGRRLFFGYPGTLHSHGLDYREREKVASSPQEALRCRETSSSNICPSHLVWTKEERQRWRSIPESPNLLETDVPLLYQFK